MNDPIFAPGRGRAGLSALFALAFLWSSAGHAQTRAAASAPSPKVAAAAPADTGSSGEPLDPEQAVAQAARENPNLHAALLTVRQSQYGVDAAEDLYYYDLTLSASAERSRNPSWNQAAGEVLTGTSYDYQLGATLSRTFPIGTQVQLSLTGDRNTRISPVIVTIPTLVTIGPTYLVGAQLTVTQPLLRNAGTRVGLSSLRIARLNRTAAEQTAENTANQLIGNVLNGYWELWYAGRTVAINQQSRDLEEVQREQAAQKASVGTLAASEVLTFQTQVATLDEQVVTARETEHQQALALGQLLGNTAANSEDFVASSVEPPEPAEPPEESAAIRRAIQVAPDLAQLETQIKLAREQAEVAGESLRPRLDLSGMVQSQGLGNQSVPPALDQFGTLGAFTAQITLTYETPLGSGGRDAQIAQANYQIHIARAQALALRQQIEGNVRLLYAKRRAAAESLKLGLRTVDIAKKQLDGEKASFAAGAAVAIQVEQAEDAVRQAELRVERSRADLVEAEIGIDQATGALLDRYRSLIAQQKPASPSPSSELNLPGPRLF
jgi:outer membrane protein